MNKRSENEEDPRSGTVPNDRSILIDTDRNDEGQPPSFPTKSFMFHGVRILLVKGFIQPS